MALKVVHMYIVSTVLLYFSVCPGVVAYQRILSRVSFVLFNGQVANGRIRHIG